MNLRLLHCRFFMSFNEIWGYQMFEENKTQKFPLKVVDSDRDR